VTHSSFNNKELTCYSYSAGISNYYYNTNTKYFYYSVDCPSSFTGNIKLPSKTPTLSPVTNNNKNYIFKDILVIRYYQRYTNNYYELTCLSLGALMGSIGNNNSYTVDCASTSSSSS
jgi:hypothetical protein